MKGDLRCVEGRTMRHDPQHDDPDLETDIGECEFCGGDGCDDDQDSCTDQRGHEWTYTGTAYGGDDERWCGEGRCYCVHCGADGDA